MAKTAKKQEGSPRDDATTGKIKRPANAWILYRSEQIVEYKRTAEPGKPLLMQAELSRLISDRWRDLPLAERNVWFAKADQAKKEHEAKHPDYTYMPESKADKALRLAREKEEKAAASLAKKEANRAAKRSKLSASAFTNKALGVFASDVARMAKTEPSTESYIPEAALNAAVFDPTDSFERSGPLGPSPAISLATTPEPDFFKQSPGAGPSNYAASSRHVSLSTRVSPSPAPPELTLASPAPQPNHPMDVSVCIIPFCGTTLNVTPQNILDFIPQPASRLPSFGWNTGIPGIAPELTAMDASLALDPWTNDGNNLAIPLSGTGDPNVWDALFATPGQGGVMAPVGNVAVDATIGTMPTMDATLSAPTNDVLTNLFNGFDWTTFPQTQYFDPNIASDLAVPTMPMPTSAPTSISGMSYEAMGMVDPSSVGYASSSFPDAMSGTYFDFAAAVGNVPLSAVPTPADALTPAGVELTQQYHAVPPSLSVIIPDAVQVYAPASAAPIPSSTLR